MSHLFNQGLVSWELVKNFKYNLTNQKSFDDIYIQDFLDSLTDTEIRKLDINFLKKKKISCISSETDKELYIWSIYKCIYCEIKIEDNLYLLNNSKKLNNDFQIPNPSSKPEASKYHIKIIFGIRSCFWRITFK